MTTGKEEVEKIYTNALLAIFNISLALLFLGYICIILVQT